MLWKKPHGMKYTDMCIWIDSSGVIPRIAENPGMYPKDENLVYNYLFLLCRMLIKDHARGLKFEDHEPFAFFAANYYYFQLIKNWKFQGQMVKGRLKTPIKNILDYIKNNLRLRRMEYQHQYYAERTQIDIDGTANSKNTIDACQYTMKLISEAESACFKEETMSRIRTACSGEQLILLLDEFMTTTPFKKGTTDWYNFRTCILLNTQMILTKKGKLTKLDPSMSIQTWHLPKSLSTYVLQLTNEFFDRIKDIIIELIDSTRPDARTLDVLISNPDGIYEEENY